MKNEFTQRGYLVPDGCKDLMDDILKLKPKAWSFKLTPQWEQDSTALPPITSEIAVPEKTTPLDLASLLEQKPFQIIADLMQLKIMATINQPLDFEIISFVAREHGFIAKRILTPS